MIISVAQAQIFLLALTRVLAVLIHIPVLAGASVPNQMKLGLGVLLTIVLLPWQPLPADAAAMSIFALGMAIFREILIGTLAGFAAQLTFSALQIAGEMIGLGSGFASGRILNPALETSGSAIDQLFLMMSMLLFLALNGHHSVLMGLQQTFVAIPVNSALVDMAPDRVMRMTAQFIAAGFQLSLPVMGTLLLTDLTLGLLARVAPQIQVFFLGVPMKVAIGLIVLALSLGALLPSLSEMFHSMDDRAVYLLGG